MIDKNQKRIFLIALALTISVFLIGIFISYGLDFVRTNELLNEIRNQEIDASAYVVETEFIEIFGGNTCEALNKKIIFLSEDVKETGTALNTYKRRSFFKKQDFDYLKRRYFLLELQFLNLLNELNNKCGVRTVPIIFFYEKDDKVNERQGYILDDVRKEMKDRVAILTFDVDYEDEETLNLLKLHYNITKTPTIIINNDVKEEEIKYSGEIREIVNRFLG